MLGITQTFFKPSGFMLVCTTEMLTYQLVCIRLPRTENYCLNNQEHCSFSYQIQHLDNIHLNQFFQ